MFKFSPRLMFIYEAHRIQLVHSIINHWEMFKESDLSIKPSFQFKLRFSLIELGLTNRSN